MFGTIFRYLSYRWCVFETEHFVKRDCQMSGRLRVGSSDGRRGAGRVRRRPVVESHHAPAVHVLDGLRIRDIVDQQRDHPWAKHPGGAFIGD